jgi:hypothetical protein
MGYCTSHDIENIISQSLTSATSPTASGLNSSTKLSLLKIGTTFDKNLITDSIVDSYIQMSDATIDAKFSQMYKVPFSELVDLETTLYSPIDEYSQLIILSKVVPFNPGDKIILLYSTHEASYTVGSVLSPTVISIDDPTTATVEGFTYNFPAGTRIVRLCYPNPIRFISARMAAANIYDKYFSGEVSPNTSAYGKYLRQIARQDINDILNGRTTLHGQQRIGRRFYNPNLVEQYDLPKGQDGAKDTGELTI